jgi:hypothetical protein
MEEPTSKETKRKGNLVAVLADRSPHERQEQFERQSTEIITPVVMTPDSSSDDTNNEDSEDPLPNLTRGSKSCIIGMPRRIGRNPPKVASPRKWGKMSWAPSRGLTLWLRGPKGY